MRPILFTNPLLSLPKSKKAPAESLLRLSARMEKMITILGEKEENKVLAVAGSIIESLTEDTHTNIDSAFRLLISLI
jgi:hypothetical protein